MVNEIHAALRSTGGAVIAGVRTPAQADKLRDYIRLAEAKLGEPVSCTWMGTLSVTAQRVRGRIVGDSAVKVIIEVV